MMTPAAIERAYPKVRVRMGRKGGQIPMSTENLLFGLSSRELFQDQFNSDPSAPNDRFAQHDLWV